MIRGFLSKNDYLLPSLKTIIPNSDKFGEPEHLKYIYIYVKNKKDPKKLILVSNRYRVLIKITNLRSSHHSIFTEIKNKMSLFGITNNFNIKPVGFDKYCFILENSDHCKKISLFFNGSHEYIFHNDPENINKKSSPKETVIQEQVNIMLKTIDPHPRNVHISNKIREKLNDEKISSIVNTISWEVRTGKNLNVRLTKLRSDPNHNDIFYNISGMLHLHTNNIMETSTAVSRSDLLMFILVSQDAIYLIDVLNHPKNKTDWQPLYLLNIVLQNWPQLIARFKMSHIKPPFDGSRTTDPEIMKGSAAGLNPVFTLDDGCVYRCIGGGSMSDGTNSNVISISDRIEDYLYSVVKRTLFIK